MLAASNVGIQCVLAPTREDVDRAHAQLRWLGIGIWSWKNFMHAPWSRRMACVVLMLSSVPLHLL